MRAIAILAALACACGGGGTKQPVAAKPAPPAPVAPAAPSVAKPGELTGAVKAVRVEGAADALRAQIQTALAGAVGKPLDVDQLREGLVQVMRLAGVADVDVQGVQLAGGVELVVQVTMHPVMRNLTAVEAGGKTIPLGMSAIPSNTPLQPHRLQALATSLRERYLAAGHVDVEVTWRRVPVAGGVDVVLEVTPGVPSTIGSVAFKGNTIAGKTLAGQLSTLLVVGQPLLEVKLQDAAEALSRYYWDHGYANVKVESPKPVAGANALVFQIVEGPQFRMGPIEIRGAAQADHAKYLKLFGVKKGDIFNRTAIADGRKRLVDAIVATGKPNADVLPLTRVDTTARTIALTLEVTGL